MSAVRQGLVSRIGSVLGELEWSSEAPTAGPFDKDRVTGSSEQAIPRLEKTSFDHFLEKFERVCAEAEDRVKSHRKRQAPPMTTQQYDFWFFETYAGKSPAVVADAENMKPDAVRKKRERAGRDPRTGHPKT